MGFDGERPGEPVHTQPPNAYPPQQQYQSPAPHYSPVHALPAAPAFNSPPYAGYPPNTNHGGRGGNREALEPNPFHSSAGNRGGRGGMHNGRGRGGRDNNTFNDRNKFNRNDRNTRDYRENRDNRGGRDGNKNQKKQDNAASIPSAAVDTAENGKSKKKKKKRKTNTLGLTPAGEDHVDSEEEDDVDEEARLAAAIGDTQHAP